jgi:DNA helicase HerA-like ATPase
MIQPKIQTIYIPVNPGDITKYPKCTLADIRGKDQFLSEQKLITFTPEEFETFKREFGKELLEKAAENAKLHKSYFLKAEDPEFYYKYEDDEDSYIHRDTNGTILGLDTLEVNKESITSVLDNYLLNNKL